MFESLRSVVLRFSRNWTIPQRELVCINSGKEGLDMWIVRNYRWRIQVISPVFSIQSSFQSPSHALENPGHAIAGPPTNF